MPLRGERERADKREDETERVGETERFELKRKKTL